MDRHRIVRGRWAGLITHLLHIARPGDGKRLWAPFLLKEGTIRTLRRAIYSASDIGQPHFDRVGRRPLSPLGRGLPKRRPVARMSQKLRPTRSQALGAYVFTSERSGPIGPKSFHTLISCLGERARMAPTSFCS
jgi:hypothetical protein